MSVYLSLLEIVDCTRGYQSPAPAQSTWTARSCMCSERYSAVEPIMGVGHLGFARYPTPTISQSLHKKSSTLHFAVCRVCAHGESLDDWQQNSIVGIIKSITRGECRFRSRSRMKVAAAPINTSDTSVCSTEGGSESVTDDVAPPRHIRTQDSNKHRWLASNEYSQQSIRCTLYHPKCLTNTVVGTSLSNIWWILLDMVLSICSMPIRNVGQIIYSTCTVPSVFVCGSTTATFSSWVFLCMP